MSKNTDMKHAAAQAAFEAACNGLITTASSMVSETTKKAVSEADRKKAIEAKMNKALAGFLTSLTPEEYNEGQIQKFKRGDYLIVEVFIGQEKK